MALIREPKGIDFIIGPSALTDEDRKMISAAIASYKLNGRIPSKSKQRPRGKKIKKQASVS